MSTIQNLKTIKEFLLELYRDNLNQLKTPKIKDILSKRKHTFIKEYLKMNSISISTTCSVKTDSVYKTGQLILKNSKLIINQYESNKTEQKRINNSINQHVDILFPIFFIDFNMVTCELVVHKTKQKFRLIILGKNLKKKDYDNNDDFIYKYRVVKFAMLYQSKEVFNLICENINKSIILSYGSKYNIFSISIRNNFCKEYFINYKKFALEANSGDIILFKGYSNDSKFQRFLTSAEYDHVGIMVKNKYGLNLYESTGKDGAKLRPWEDFITYYWYLLYDVMSFRKLKIDDETKKLYILEQNNGEKIEDINDNKKLNEKFYFYFNKKIDEFISKSEHKKYYFSKIGYFCHSKMKKKSLIRESYSCSELIGALYYYVGIITDELEARNYLPGHFSRNGEVAFKKGFQLGEEYIIDFSSTMSN